MVSLAPLATRTSATKLCENDYAGSATIKHKGGNTITDNDDVGLDQNHFNVFGSKPICRSHRKHGCVSMTA
eukprot:m.86156 g.86156  ORF g.86156 m.86156 type:complete len:71 (-) comp25933_c0_seq1:22-234(-)